MDGDLSFYSVELMGHGPTMLPEGYKYENYETSKWGDKTTVVNGKASFILNENGTIAQENWTYDNSANQTYNFTYSPKNGSTMSVALWQQSKKASFEEVKEKINRLMNAFSIKSFK